MIIRIRRCENLPEGVACIVLAHCDDDGLTYVVAAGPGGPPKGVAGRATCAASRRGWLDDAPTVTVPVTPRRLGRRVRQAGATAIAVAMITVLPPAGPKPAAAAGTVSAPRVQRRRRRYAGTVGSDAPGEVARIRLGAAPRRSCIVA
jgi:hypothetical protein